MIISGGIAAYRALETARQLQKRGAHVTGVMTESAKQFITPLSLAALTGEKCYDSLFSLTDEAEMGHIQLARSADLVLVAPATANFMARANAGIADDLATTILLATTAKVVMAPAMNPAMWTHPATKNNFASLAQRGVHMIGPDNGDTACGEEGYGRMCEPSHIADVAMTLVSACPPITCLTILPAKKNTLVRLLANGLSSHLAQRSSQLIKYDLLPIVHQANKAMQLLPHWLDAAQT